jgi:hypothetical protein
MFVNWILQRVTIVTFSVIVNGGRIDHFSPTRGLRQGDPLSPYLFILCQDVLSRLIDQQFHLRNIFGVKMNVYGPAITHVMFADDLMIFSKANKREIGILNDCLETYCLWSRQKINKEKYGVIFSKLVHNDTKRWIRGELQMKKLALDSFYLGTPVFSSTSKTKDLKYLTKRLDSRLKGCRCKALSWAGRKTLIKSVAQALPTYTFSTADVPMTICHKLDSTIRRFWWNPKKVQGNFMAWCSWDSLCQPIEAGGLGFRESKNFNKALLAKLTWWIASRRDSLCVRALRSKYKVQANWLGGEPCKNASPLWRAIEKLRDVVKKGACFAVGDGSSIDMWKDPWVPWLEGFIPTPKDPTLPITSLPVSNLIDPVTRKWRINVLKELVDSNSLEAIEKIIIPLEPLQDKLIWTLDPCGIYTVKSAINYCLTPRTSYNPADSLWKQLWKLKMHERLKVFLWRLGSNALPTKQRVFQRTGYSNPMCLMLSPQNKGYFKELVIVILCALCVVWKKKAIHICSYIAK